jgi:hypothetical protein
MSRLDVECDFILYIEIMNELGYAVVLQNDALTLPDHWRVRLVGRWFYLEYWITRGQRSWWERYGVYQNAQDAIEKAVELPCP